MGTWAAYFRRSDFIPAMEPSKVRANTNRAAAKAATETKAAHAPYKLRALPNDDIYFYCKRIDNSRLIRQADPKTKGQCLSAIGAACVLAVLTGSVMAPKIATVLAGYKLQELRHERSELVQERRSLEVEEATLLSPGRLDELAQKQKLDRPGTGQVVHLQPRGEGAFASVIVPAGMSANVKTR